MPDSGGSEQHGRRWYVVQTRPRQEHVAAENLARQGYRLCLPKARLRKRRSGRWGEVVEPLFPGYLFVALALGDDNAAPIRSTIGCRRLVRFGLEYAALPESVMQSLMSLDDEPVALQADLKAGDRVRLQEGPFAGLEAVFEIPRGEDRARVLISVLGAERAVIVRREDLGWP